MTPFRIPQDAPVILVLGARVNPDGTPSAALIRRVEHSVKLARMDARTCLVLSGGGVGPRPEAALAKEICIRLGLDPEQIFLESKSATTVENIFMTRALLPRRTGITLVTDAYHLPRACLLARLAGLSVRPSAPPGRPRAPKLMKAILRECLTLVPSLVQAGLRRQERD